MIPIEKNSQCLPKLEIKNSPSPSFYHLGRCKSLLISDRNQHCNDIESLTKEMSHIYNIMIKSILTPYTLLDTLVVLGLIMIEKNLNYVRINRLRVINKMEEKYNLISK